MGHRHSPASETWPSLRNPKLEASKRATVIACRVEGTRRSGISQRAVFRSLWRGQPVSLFGSAGPISCCVVTSQGRTGPIPKDRRYELAEDWRGIERSIGVPNSRRPGLALSSLFAPHLTVRNGHCCPLLSWALKKSPNNNAKPEHGDEHERCEWRIVTSYRVS
jgi:hypothetical protein